MPQPKRWIDEILQVYEELGGVASYQDVYSRIEERGFMDLAANKHWQAAVRRTVEQYSSDSDAYFNKEDYFFTVQGKGKGIWGLRNVVSEIDKSKVSATLRRMKEIDLEILFQSSEDEINELLMKLSDDGRIEEKITLTKIRKASQATIRHLKRLYNHTCQICGVNHMSDYGVNVVEAHHIEYFSVSQNHQPKNIIILCPTHHRLVHAGDAVFDRDRELFIYSNGLEEALSLNKHLK